MIDFLVDFLKNINAKKIGGAILVLVGLALIGRIGTSEDANRGVLLAVAGIIVGGIGFVIIYYDIARDKSGSGHNELNTLANAYKQKEREERKATGWHMDESSDNKASHQK